MATRLETVKPAAWWLWALALVGSLALHVGLVRLNPNLLMGQSPVRPARQQDPVKAIQLLPRPAVEYKRALPGLLDRYASSPENTGLNTPELEMPAEGIPDGEAFNSVGQEIRQDVADAGLPEGLTDVEDPESDWMPQQEVLAITRQRVDEELDFLPRRFRKTGPSHIQAPDIRLPDDPPRVGGNAAGEGLFDPTALDVPAGGASLGVPELDIPGLGMGGLPDRFGLPEGIDLPELDQRGGKSNPSTPELKAVESLLRLETRVWKDSRDPDVQYVKLQIDRNGIEQLPAMPRDVVYLIDCSASMTEEKLQIALRGVRSSLDSLKPEDRFLIAAFRNEVQLLDSEFLPATVLNRAKARTFLSGLHAHGKTDVFLSLELLKDIPPDSGRPVQALVITDGVPTQGVTDTSEILNRFSQANKGNVSVFALGGGKRVNRLLLDFLSFRNRGRALVTEATQALPVAIRNVSDEISRPVLTNLSYRFTQAERLDVYPRQLSHLYVDGSLILVARVPADQKTIGFQMIGDSTSGQHDIVFDVDLTKAQTGGPDLRREWAWQALLEEMSTLASGGGADARKRLTALIRDYDLNVPSAYMKRLPKE